MNPYLLLPLASCLACCMLAVAILARDSSRRASRAAALLALCCAFWAGCDLLWSTATRADVALGLVRLSAPGWMLIGPVVFQLFLELTGHPMRRRVGVLAPLYAAGALLVLADWATPWVHPGVRRTTWGWGYEIGWLFGIAYVYTAGFLTLGLAIGIRRFHAWRAPGVQGQLLWLVGGLLLPLLIASVTDGLAPMVGLQLPRLGAASVTLLVATVAWTSHRFGYSLLAPGVFAPEILSTLREGVLVVRLDGHVHSANQGMAALLGTRPDRLEGLEIGRLVPGLHVDPPSEVSERELSLRGEDGVPVPVSVTSALLRDRQGATIGLVVVVRDLREVQSLRSRLITSGRLASVGQLAAGIAHEINNPVAFVRANLGALRNLQETLVTKLPAEVAKGIEADFQEGAELVLESLEGIDRVAAIVRDVRSFSHAGVAGGQELVELHPLLDSVLRVAGPQLRYCRLERDYGEVAPVRGAPQELKQVFLNLVVNACQAVGPEERVLIRTRQSQDRVHVDVIDDGCGIPPDVMERVFDPFFTTKPVGEGTGLGLSISYEIVRSHRGELSVVSQPGEGTRVSVSLPIAPVDPPNPGGDAPPCPSGSSGSHLNKEWSPPGRR